jgi:hypothetical protein
LASIHKDGPGLKKIGNEKWYGPGYCGICGCRKCVDDGDEYGLVPQAVRYWDPDDGWRMGVLCVGCGEDCYRRGPQPGDYASQVLDGESQAEGIDTLADLYDRDLDGVYSDQDIAARLGTELLGPDGHDHDDRDAGGL